MSRSEVVLVIYEKKKKKIGDLMGFFVCVHFCHEGG